MDCLRVLFCRREGTRRCVLGFPMGGRGGGRVERVAEMVEHGVGVF